MRPLNELEVSQLLDCANGHDIRSSGRAKDRAKQELRRRGLIAYVGRPIGKPKRWHVTSRGNEVAATLDDSAPSTLPASAMEDGRD